MNKKFLLTAVFGLFLTSNLNARDTNNLYENIGRSVEAAALNNTLNEQKIDELVSHIDENTLYVGIMDEPNTKEEKAIDDFFNSVVVSAQKGKLRDDLMKLKVNGKLGKKLTDIFHFCGGYIGTDSLLISLYENNLLNSKNIGILKEFHIIDTRNNHFTKNIEGSLIWLFTEANVSNDKILNILTTFEKAGLLREFKVRIQGNDKEVLRTFSNILLHVAYNNKGNNAQRKIQIISNFFRGK